MKLFWKQLKLLLWKNFTLRKRQMFRNVVEVVWPLVLFIILVAVRTRRPPENNPLGKYEMHYRPRALPSAGLLPFLQSFVCDFDVSKNFSSVQEIPSLVNTNFTRLVSQFMLILQNQQDIDIFRQLPIDLEDINDIMSRLNQLRSRNSSELALSDFISDTESFKKLLVSTGAMNETLADAFIHSKVEISALVDAVLSLDWRDISLQNASQEIQFFNTTLCGPNGIKTWLDVPHTVTPEEVQNALCGMSFIQLTVFFTDLYENVNGTAFLKELQNNTELYDLYTRSESLIQRLTKLMEDTQFLNDVGGVWSLLRPYLDSLSYSAVSGNGSEWLSNPLSNFDLYSMVCNRPGAGDPASLANPTPNPTSASPLTDAVPSIVNSSTGEPETFEPDRSYLPTRGGSSDEQCNSIHPLNRTDCGWPGVSESRCLSMDCCYDDTIMTDHVKVCFCKPEKAKCCKSINNMIHLIGNVSGTAGAGARDTMFVYFAALVLRGKVFYAPDNSKTRQVISKMTSALTGVHDILLDVMALGDSIPSVVNFTEELVRDEVNLETVVNSSRWVRDNWEPMLTALSSFAPAYREQVQQLLNITKEYVKYADSVNVSTIRRYLTEDNIQLVKGVARDLEMQIRTFRDTFECLNLTSYFVPFKSESDLVKAAVGQSKGIPVMLSSVVFMNLNEDEPWPKKLKFKLRLDPDLTPSTDRVIPNFWRPGPGPWGLSYLHNHAYLTFGFVFMQDLIERSLIDILANTTVSEPGVYVQQFPYPCFIQDRYMLWLSNSMSFFMTLAWVYSMAMIVKSIVYEKELRLKEVMKVMGLSDSVHWTAWFITSFVVMNFSIILLTAILKFGGVLIYSNFLVVMFTLEMFAIASISMAFLISVFFSKANIAAACGGMVYLFSYLPYTLTYWFENRLSFSHQGLASLSSTTAFGLALKYISRYEVQAVGAQWRNLFHNPVSSDAFSLGWTWVFMGLDSVMYMIIVWYLENILPGQYGVPKPWYFPFTKSYWIEKKIGFKHHQTASVSPSNQYQPQVDDELELDAQSEVASDFGGRFEREPTDLPVGVHIQNLVKIYPRGKQRAVDGLNLKFFEGQVSALLGHNGAGKSTTMAMLTGLYPPTAGTAVVYGCDIRTDMHGVRRSLGFCPQHNVLFDEMTVEEHMWFYGMLKGMSKQAVKKEIERFLKDVGLPEKRHEIARNLSGGMKRKLSVAMAFIAYSKTVILDEPTSGVDPYSRRSIWDLILKYKHDRTILISTHYMDEADLLGDRISIISSGRLQCSGSPLFLKRHFGKGYFLTVVRDTEATETFDLDKVTDFIVSHLPGAALRESVGTETTYTLPPSQRATGAFTKLFQSLEKSMSSMGIQNYGISDTTLEEVFLKACDEEDTISNESPESDTISLTGPVQSRRPVSDSASMTSIASDISLLQRYEAIADDMNEVDISTVAAGPRLWLQQYFALLVKRFQHAKRSRKGFFSQILLPAIFVVAAMAVSMIRPPKVSMPSLELSSRMFPAPNYVVVSNANRSVLSDDLMASLMNAPGPGNACTRPSKCSDRSFPYKPNQTRQFDYELYPGCSCATGKQKCPAEAMGPRPWEAKLPTGDTVVDVSDRSYEEYILRTTDRYVAKRYGGVSLGDTSASELSSNVSRSGLPSLYGVQHHVKVWHNLKGYHALPTYVNVLNNAILRANLDPSQDPSEYGIIAYNHPMEYNKEQLSEETLMQGITDVSVAIFVIAALSFVPASFLVYLVTDRVNKSKHLQLASGLHPIIYWLGSYSWDMINYLIPAAACLIIFLAFNQKAYVSAANFPATLSLLLLYGWSMTPLMYPASFFFDVPSTAYIVLICLNLFVGIIGTMATFILEFFRDDPELLMIGDALKRVLLVFPNYCLGRGLMELARNQLESDAYAVFGEEKFKNPFAWKMIGRNIFAMVVGGIVYFTLTLLVQYRFFIKKRSRRVEKLLKNRVDEEDVLKERRTVMEGSDDAGVVLKIKNVTKLYPRFGGRGTLAVDRLCFAVKEGECFGLLGVNGAGKTSTFQMLTGDTSITDGDAFVKGCSVRSQLDAAHRFMGYCPQFDALDELLTGKELLVYYARIRGLCKHDADKVSDWAIETLGLSEYQHRICGDYSGGNKRKLSTAIALIGSPPIIFLDEPTTGMDPGARRFLWNVISGLLRAGKSVVLTSHSMEECEALCTRLGIMVNGVFRCIGSPQHLRSKFGMGYTVIIRAKRSHVESVKNFFTANFFSAELKDHHQYMLEYQVPMTGLLLSEVFHKLELLREMSLIDDYSVTQTTLDQIFVNFARSQVEAVHIRNEPNDMSFELDDVPAGATVV